MWYQSDVDPDVRRHSAPYFGMNPLHSFDIPLSVTVFISVRAGEKSSIWISNFPRGLSGLTVNYFMNFRCAMNARGHRVYVTGTDHKSRKSGGFYPFIRPIERSPVVVHSRGRALHAAPPQKPSSLDSLDSMLEADEKDVVKQPTSTDDPEPSAKQLRFTGRMAGKTKLMDLPDNYDMTSIPEEYRINPTLGGQTAKETLRSDNLILLTLTATLTSIILVVLNLTSDGSFVDDLIYGEDGFGGVIAPLLDLNWGAGDILGAVLWSVSLWFVTPIQVLLLFFGFVETERPSDLLIRFLSRTNKEEEAKEMETAVDDPENGLSVQRGKYANVKALAYLLTVAQGAGIALVFNLLLDDSTWSVATGLGTLMAAGVYEVGRPRRLDVEEARELESQWVDFNQFADENLLKTGQCHESDIFSAFRKSHPAYRRPEVLSDLRLRDMVRNWHSGSSRTGTGFIKGVSLAPKRDPFTGEFRRGSNSNQRN